MLSAIAETGVYWSEGDEGDRGTVDKMRSVVDRVVTEFDGDMEVFESLSEDLGSHLQILARKAEVAERRHVEAAKGKERLALARATASEAVAVRIKGHKISRFAHTLLTQAWTDVLALSLLRHGEDSADYRRQLAIAERLTLAASSSPDRPSVLSRHEAVALREEIAKALAQVGYHAEDAKAIAARLTSVEEGVGADDPASRTELALRMKARSRLGGDLLQDNKSQKAKLPPLNTAERACYDRVRALPFGAWLEFIVNQQGEIVRRRMSWFSTVTGHALFVNARGQRVGEYTLDWLARAMAKDQVRVVAGDRSNVIDRTWGAIVTALKGFGTAPTPPAAHAGARS